MTCGCYSMETDGSETEETSTLHDNTAGVLLREKTVTWSAQTSATRGEPYLLCCLIEQFVLR